MSDPTSYEWLYFLSLNHQILKSLYVFYILYPVSNAYVESAFSQLKHLLNNKRNCMRTELISAELKIRLNSSLSCTEMYKYLLGNQVIFKSY